MPVPSLPLDAPANINMEALAESDTIALPVEDVLQFLWKETTLRCASTTACFSIRCAATLR